MSARLSVCVYCGSRDGASPAYARAATAIGDAVARRGWQLVYGGGRAGLMGRVADAALAAGGQVVGVIPRTLMEREVGHAGLTELHVVDTMHQRKRLMAERSDAFIALPGGIGTFEELFEIWTWRQLGYHDKPVGILNAAGYYDGLTQFIGSVTSAGFMNEWQSSLIAVGDEAGPLLQRLVQDAGTNADDSSRLSEQM